MFIKAYESNGQWIAETATTRYTGETLEKAVESFHKAGGVAAIEVGIWSPRLHELHGNGNASILSTLRT